LLIMSPLSLLKINILELPPYSNYLTLIINATII